jgi:signal peptidase I
MATSSGSGVAPAKSVPMAHVAGRVLRWLLAPVAGVGLAGLGALAWLILAQRRVTVRGQSMRPRLRDGERVLVDRLAYRIGRPRRGDVALVQNEAADGPGLLLKRIVGLPGETVAVERDRLWIDGEPLDLGRPVVGSSPGRWTLAADAYFLLSENLAIGTDSRHTGPVRRAVLLGRAWLVYAPSVRRLTAASWTLEVRSSKRRPVQLRTSNVQLTP